MRITFSFAPARVLDGKKTKVWYATEKKRKRDQKTRRLRARRGNQKKKKKGCEDRSAKTRHGRVCLFLATFFPRKEPQSKVPMRKKKSRPTHFFCRQRASLRKSSRENSSDRVLMCCVGRASFCIDSFFSRMRSDHGQCPKIRARTDEILRGRVLATVGVCVGLLESRPCAVGQTVKTTHTDRRTHQVVGALCATFVLVFFSKRKGDALHFFSYPLQGENRRRQVHTDTRERDGREKRSRCRFRFVFLFLSLSLFFSFFPAVWGQRSRESTAKRGKKGKRREKKGIR